MPLRFALDQIGLFRRGADKGFGGAGFGDGADGAVEAAVVKDLEIHRAVAEGGAAFAAFGAADAFFHIDVVFVIDVFDVGAADGLGGADLVFGGLVVFQAFGVLVAGADFAVAADGNVAHALDHRGGQDTGAFTLAAPGAFVGIDLPNHLVAGLGTIGSILVGGHQTLETQGANANQGGTTQAFFQDITPGLGGFRMFTHIVSFKKNQWAPFGLTIVIPIFFVGLYPESTLNSKISPVKTFGLLSIKGKLVPGERQRTFFP